MNASPRDKGESVIYAKIIINIVVYWVKFSDKIKQLKKDIYVPASD